MNEHLARGANVNAATEEEGYTAFDFANNQKSYELARLLHVGS